MSNRVALAKLGSAREQTARYFGYGDWGEGEFGPEAWLARDLVRTEQEAVDGASAMVALATHASPYLVTAEMVDLLELAMLDLPAFDLHPSDLMTPDGFAVFERPLSIPTEADDDFVDIEAIGWLGMEGASGVLISAMQRSGARDGPVSWPPMPNAMIPAVYGMFCGWRFGERFDAAISGWVLIAAFLRLIQERRP